MRLPNLNALRMFDAAARHLTFRAAAEELHLTQGAVAQQVRRLEADLGQRLFERKARGLALTPVGAQYHKPIRAALEQIGQATAALAPDTARVTISVPPSFAAKWLVPRLRDFEIALPDIDLQIVAEEALARFDTGAVQMAVRQGHAPTDRDLDSTELAPLDLCAVVGTDVPEAADLGDYVLIQDGHRHWDAQIAAGLITPRHRMIQMNQTALAMDAAQNGRGVALVPRIYVGMGQGLRILSHSEAGAGQGFHLIWPRSRRLNRAERAVAGWIAARMSGSQEAQQSDGATKG